MLDISPNICGRRSGECFEIRLDGSDHKSIFVCRVIAGYLRQKVKCAFRCQIRSLTLTTNLFSRDIPPPNICDRSSSVRFDVRSRPWLYHKSIFTRRSTTEHLQWKVKCAFRCKIGSLALTINPFSLDISLRNICSRRSGVYFEVRLALWQPANLFVVRVLLQKFCSERSGWCFEQNLGRELEPQIHFCAWCVAADILLQV